VDIIRNFTIIWSFDHEHCWDTISGTNDNFLKDSPILTNQLIIISGWWGGFNPTEIYETQLG